MNHAPVADPTRAVPAPVPPLPAVGETCRRAVTATVTSDGKRSTFLFTTGGDARDGMILEPAGLDVAAYERNTVVLWQHGMDFQRGNLPIGKASNVTRTDEGAGGWTADVTFTPDDFGKAIGQMVDEGFLSAVSIGWRTLDAGWETRDGKEVYVIRRAEMMEFSVVAVPADADALVTARAQDNNALRDEVQRLRTEVEALRAAQAEPVAPNPEGTGGTDAEPETNQEPQAAEGPGTVPVRAAAPRALTPEETLAAFAALVPSLELAHDRALGRA